MSDLEHAVPRTSGPGAGHVGVPGIFGIAIYLATFAALLLYVLIAIWPVPTPSGTSPPREVASAAKPANAAGERTANTIKDKDLEPKDVTLFGHTWKMWDEVRLLIMVISAGALGSLVHGLRSVYWYVGNRELVWSWTAKYLLLPFSGATLAVLFYFVVRGGFFSPQAGFPQTSPFGFCALASLVGLFSEQAVLKLKQIAETVFTNPKKAKTTNGRRRNSEEQISLMNWKVQTCRDLDAPKPSCAEVEMISTEPGGEPKAE